MKNYVAMTLLQLAGWLALLSALLGGALLIDAEITLDAVTGVGLLLFAAGLWVGVIFAVKTFPVPSWYQSVSLFVVSFVVVMLLTAFY